MSQRSQLRPKTFALIFFHVDETYSVVETKKIKVSCPLAGQKNVEYPLYTGKKWTNHLCDIVELNGKCFYYFILWRFQWCNVIYALSFVYVLI